MRRFRILIIATIACLVLLGVAAISVSLAAWTRNGDNTEVAIEGAVGQFYIEYPEYVSDSGADIPPLADGVYYLQVPHANEQKVSDYYALTDNNGTSINPEKMIKNVYLQAGTVIDLYYGTARIGIKYNKSGGTSNASHSSVSCNYTVLADGYYDFYYEYTYNTMYVDYSASFDPTDYTKSINITFSDDTVSKTLHFKTAVTTGDYSSLDNLSVYIFDGDDNVLYSSSSGSPKTIADGQTINVGSKTNTMIIFGFGENWNYQTSDLLLSNYAVNADNYITLHSTYKGNPTFDERKEAAVTSFTGATDFDSDDIQLNGDAVIRQAVMRGTQNEKGTYTYHNYICVSRKNADGDDDNSIAFIIFEVQSLDGKDLDTIDVESVTLRRIAADENGSLTDSEGFTPRLYVDSYNNASTTQAINKLSDFNHEKVQTTAEQQSNQNYVAEYYTKGAYCILFFADGGNQYYALDIEIVTKQEANFMLTATASNTNHWQRYIAGYGEPYGYYLGGLINNVWLWDPRRTTKFNEQMEKPDYTEISYTGEGKAEYPDYIDITLTVNLTANSVVKAYMLGSNGFRWDGETGEMPTEGRVAYLLPSEIVAPDALKDALYFTNDGNLNLVIPENGDYTFRYVGTVSTRDASGKGIVGGNYVSIANFNFIVEQLIISVVSSEHEYTVTFDSGEDGSYVAPQKVLFGYRAVKPEDPTNSDKYKRFVGWYTDNTFVNEYDFDSLVTKDITLYAKWASESTYTMTFDPRAGVLSSGTPNTAVTDTLGRLASLPEPTRDGYSFDGWYMAVENGDKVTAGYEFTDAERFMRVGPSLNISQHITIKTILIRQTTVNKCEYVYNQKLIR